MQVAAAQINLFQRFLKVYFIFSLSSPSSRTENRLSCSNGTGPAARLPANGGWNTKIITNEIGSTPLNQEAFSDISIAFYDSNISYKHSHNPDKALCGIHASLRAKLYFFCSAYKAEDPSGLSQWEKSKRESRVLPKHVSSEINPVQPVPSNESDTRHCHPEPANRTGIVR